MRGDDHVDRVIAKWKQERPELDLAPVEIIGRAGRIMAYVDQALESKFGQFGVSRASFDVLATLRRSGRPYRMTQRDLMRSLLRTSGGMSLRIDALEREGLAKREQDAGDRRSVFVVLTSKGSKLLDKILPEHLANENDLVAGLSGAERADLVCLLRKWLASLDESAEEGRHLHLGMTLVHPRASIKKRRVAGLPDVPGLLVYAVEPGSTSEECGFRKGDLICAIQDAPVTSLRELRQALGRQRPRVKQFRVRRGAETLRLQLPRAGGERESSGH